MLKGKNLLFFLLAGILGTFSRYALSNAMEYLLGNTFAWGVFTVNVIGCLLFGIIWAMAVSYRLLTESLRIVILTGFMGSFTTFSAFIFDCYTYVKAESWGSVLLFVVGQLLLGGLALRAGIMLVEAWYKPKSVTL